MNVFVETNFVLELVLLQDEHEHCDGLLDLARRGKLTLTIPAYCLAEPHETLIRRHRERRGLKQELDRTLAQLSRTRTHADRLDGFQDLTTLLVDSTQEETERLSSVREQLLDLAAIVDLSVDILSRAAALQVQHDLGPQDAFVLASV